METFEMIAIDPAIHEHDVLLAAFRAGNIALASSLMQGPEQAAAALRRYDEPVERIGVVLAASNKLK
jgi:hypothetical protein